MNTHKYLNRHGEPIDVHTYPENAARSELRDYQLAVEIAHERDGMPVESLSPVSGDWCFVVCPAFFWKTFRYRIKAPKLAEGHNPDKLTEYQVGVSEGWRLLALEEIAARSTTRAIECWDKVEWNAWGYAGSDPQSTYRTKKPVGFFLPSETGEPETDEEAIDRIWRLGLTGRGAMREVLKWERLRVAEANHKAAALRMLEKREDDK